jgi:hypothetical protein
MSEVAESPFTRLGADGEEVHRFSFRVLKLWEIPAEVILQMGWVGLLPLLTLTDGGKRPEVVKVMIDTLVSAEEIDLLALAQLVGGLAFKAGPEQEWFKRRFNMFQDILRESWVYQEIGQEFLEEERQRRIQGQHEMLASFIQAHFPEITALAKQQTDDIKDPDVLQNVILKLLTVGTVEEAKSILYSIDKSGQKQ